MRKYLILGLAVLLSFGLFAQENPDGVMMKDGKMVVIKNGKITMMGRDITFSNGSKVMNDGTLVQSDGSKKMMQEGEYRDMSGNTIKNMYLIPNEEVKKDTLK